MQAQVRVTVIMLGLLLAPTALAEKQLPERKAGYTSYTNTQGGQVEVMRGRSMDADGSVDAGRIWRATNEDGEVRRHGITTAQDNSGGSRSARNKAVFKSGDGSTIVRRAVTVSDGQGNHRMRRVQRVHDADGALNSVRHDSATSDGRGRQTRSIKRKSMDATGSMTGYVRRMDKMVNGHHKVSRAQTRRGGN